MRALLDTNIIIHRENTKATNISIGQLFYWLDALKYEKLIHPYTMKELRKYQNEQMQELYDAKLSAYTQMKTIAIQTPEFKEKLGEKVEVDNDLIDNQLLCEAYCNRVDILITEDKKMIHKAQKLEIEDRVFTINSFITKVTAENPNLIDYKFLSVRKEYFGNIDVNNHFFDTFRNSYPGFNKWFSKKCDEEAYVCRKDHGDILGFLYLKTENENENYNDIVPTFSPMRRLKVGTFKVEASGFRLGERFIKIIFDNAIERNLSEIYVTFFADRPELKALNDLLIRWGFFKYGIKHTNGKEELVLVKKLSFYDISKTPKENFPNLSYSNKKFFLPIEAKYHTLLLPDSQLRNENEVDFLGEQPQRYALQKVYISFSYKRDMKPGDFIIIYRNGVNEGRKKYESVISTIGIIDSVAYDFKSKDDFFKCCENRSVFTRSELENFWQTKKSKLLVVKFIYVKSLKKRLNLLYLWEHNIIQYNSGPRPFDTISNNHFDLILKDSNTKIFFGGDL
ncbi:MAG: PIN domain-containing protein [Candidatus Caccosoma sp.]|nr:PIN domain-containing protein [Candidatus Caccosoma sp.]